MSKKDIHHILDEIKLVFKNIYNQKLKGIILYGSYAREDAIEGSDIDLLVILKEMGSLLLEKKKYFDAIVELIYKYDIIISIIPIKEEYFNVSKLPLILNAKKEGMYI